MLRHFTVLLLVATALAGCTQTPTPSGADACDGLTRDQFVVDANRTVFAMATTQGCLVAATFDEQAPITSENFLTYIRDGFFDNTLIHRVSKDFVVQGGGWDADTEQPKQTRAPIQNEAKTSGLTNDAYTFSMARTNSPDSATSQFFINVKDNPGLDPGGFSADGYAVYAAVVDGHDVVDAIHDVEVARSSTHPYCISLEDSQGGSCPVTPVVIHRAFVLE